MLRNQQMQELNRFLHFYTRFRNHENSQKLEEPLLNNVRQKMEVLASSLGKGQKGEGKSRTGSDDDTSAVISYNKELENAKG
jgi:ankyrin repeat/IBR domain-containing protein 1